MIETWYRVIKGMMGRTCMIRLHARLFLFHFALLPYSLWLFAKYKDLRHDGPSGGEGCMTANFVESLPYMSRACMEGEQHGNYYP